LATGKLRVGQAKTAAGVRTVDLSPALREELAMHRHRSPFEAETDLVFPTTAGQPQNRNNVRNRVLKPAIVRANAKLAKAEQPLLSAALTLHSLRHTFASLLFEAGATVPYVMAQLGHIDPKLTLGIYAHVLRRREDTGARMDALVRGAEWAPMGTSGDFGPSHLLGESGSTDEKTPPERDVSDDGRGWDRTSDLSRVKRALSR
jgi:integrase